MFELAQSNLLYLISIWKSVDPATPILRNTTYYVRAYATNSQGTAYGNEESFTTNKLDLSLHNFKANNKVYDGLTTATGIWSDDRIYDDELIFSYTANFDSQNVGSEINVSFSNIEIVGGTHANKYNLITTSGNAIASITPKELYIIGDFTVKNKIYDSTTTAFIVENNLKLHGIINSDDVKIKKIEVEFTDAEIGENKVVKIINIELEGNSISNYVVSLTDAPTAKAGIYPVIYKLQLFSQPLNAAILYGEGEYAEGSKVNISINAIPGYKFINWSMIKTNDGENGSTQKLNYADNVKSILSTELVNIISLEENFIFEMPAHNVILQANFEKLFEGGEGTAEFPFEIRNAEELNNVKYFLGNEHSDKYFILINDIDLQEYLLTKPEGWTPIGNANNSFKGNFNGNSKVIYNLFIYQNNGNQIGLFGNVESGVIFDVGLEEITIHGQEDVGGLIGKQNGATVLNCYVTGNIVGKMNVGGFVGSNYFGSINNCYSRANISRVNGEVNTNFGGFIGVNYQGKIKNCYSTGNVTYIGTSNPTDKGFVGFVDNNTSEMISNFWDIETSGQFENSAGGAIGKTSLEMKTSTTFINDNWDFYGVNEGTIWNIGNGRNDGYPYFSWQYSNDLPVSVELYEKRNIVTNFELSQNYPNPFNPTTIIRYQLPMKEYISLKIYDVLGKEVAVLVNEEKDAGIHSVKFDANGLTSGVYLYRLQYGSFSQTKKLIILK